MFRDKRKLMSDFRDDYDIIKECLYGDKDAYRMLVDRYKDVIFKYIYRMTGNFHETEDITIEAFMKAYGNLKNFKFGHKFKPWIYSIAVNLARDMLRRKKLLKLVPFGGHDEETGQTGGIEMPDTSKLPDEVLEDAELKEAVKKALDCLPDKYREVFLLRYLEEFSYEEISNITGLPMGTVENRLFRAKNIIAGKKYIFRKFFA